MLMWMTVSDSGYHCVLACLSRSPERSMQGREKLRTRRWIPQLLSEFVLSPNIPQPACLPSGREPVSADHGVVRGCHWTLCLKRNRR